MKKKYLEKFVLDKDCLTNEEVFRNKAIRYIRNQIYKYGLDDYNVQGAIIQLYVMANKLGFDCKKFEYKKSSFLEKLLSSDLVLVDEGKVVGYLPNMNRNF